MARCQGPRHYTEPTTPQAVVTVVIPAVGYRQLCEACADYAVDGCDADIVS